MPDPISYGIFDWRRNGEYGVVDDLVDHAKVFCHIRDNPRLDEFGSNVPLVYERRHDRRRNRLEALGLQPLGELGTEEILRLFNDNVSALLASRYLDGILRYCAPSKIADIIRKHLLQRTLAGQQGKWADIQKVLRCIKGSPEVLDIKSEVVPFVDDASAFQLWLEDFYIPIDQGLLLNRLKVSWSGTIELVLAKATSTELSALVEHLIDTQGIKDLKKHPWSDILSWTARTADAKAKSVVKAIEEHCKPEQQYYLWMSGYTERFNLKLYVKIMAKGDSAEQHSFLRRMFKDAYEGTRKVTKDDIAHLLTYGAGNGKKNSIDHSLEIVLTILANPERGFDLPTQLGEVLSRHFTEQPKKDYSLSGIFDRCGGRVWEPSEWMARHQPEDRFCEGREAKALDKVHNAPMWWCAGKPCYQPSRAPKAADDWNKYTIIDMLSIMGAVVDNDAYELFLGALSRINEILPKLHCRTCDHILKPYKESAYAFYRATKFICNNEQCSERTVIYLNRCWNRKCLGIIDSRESAACPNGIYICQRCNSCCSKEFFKRRISVLNNVGEAVSPQLQQKWNVNAGHADVHEYFCYACGTRLMGNHDEYIRAREWLRSNYGRHPAIYKAGVRSDNRWWFLLDVTQEKYDSLQRLGFQLIQAPEYNRPLVIEVDTDRVHYLGYCPNSNCNRHNKPCFVTDELFKSAQPMQRKSSA